MNAKFPQLWTKDNLFSDWHKEEVIRTLQTLILTFLNIIYTFCHICHINSFTSTHRWSLPCHLFRSLLTSSCLDLKRRGMYFYIAHWTWLNCNLVDSPVTSLLLLGTVAHKTPIHIYTNVSSTLQKCISV